MWAGDVVADFGLRIVPSVTCGSTATCADEKCRRRHGFRSAHGGCRARPVLSYAAAMTATVNSTPHRGPLASKALALGNRAGIKAIPHLPGALKRLLSGGRAITIDGNTLDPSIQMVAASQRLLGQSGLMVGDDPAASRSQTTELSRTLDEPDVHVAATAAVSIPGLPARSRRGTIARSVTAALRCWCSSTAAASSWAISSPTTRRAD